jgi:pimeloyl-ACP methyl ester carboxylesterase
MIQTFDATLPHGITLRCRSSGTPGAPVLVFLHGFPEAAFVWDELLEHFGDRYRCVAPNLRGFGPSSSPAEVEAYRVKHLMADVEALIEQLGGGPIEALIAHDWGGAVAWALAALKPALMRRLVIINSPHPATFLRELQRSPQQQAASAYMNFLCRPDAETRLAENDFARLWSMFDNMGASDASREGGGWLTGSVRDQYRAIWNAGLRGGCNYYRASPLRPPTAQDAGVMQVSFTAEFVNVKRPTLVIWAEDDIALPVALVDGLEGFVPELRPVRVPGATHWIVHERPAFVAAEIEAHLRAQGG